MNKPRQQQTIEDQKKQVIIKPIHRLVKEVCDLQESMEMLRSKIATAEGTHQTLLGVRAGLEAELRNKSTTLFIDRDQCMGLRRGYPVTAAIKS